MSLLNRQVKVHTYICMFNISSEKVKVYLKYSLLINYSLLTKHAEFGT